MMPLGSKLAPPRGSVFSQCFQNAFSSGVSKVAIVWKGYQRLTLSHTIPTFIDPEKKNPYKNIVRKGENAGNQHFLPFPTMFSTDPKKNVCCEDTFILSSGNASNFDKSENLLFGKELTHCQMTKF